MLLVSKVYTIVLLLKSCTVPSSRPSSNCETGKLQTINLLTAVVRLKTLRAPEAMLDHRATSLLLLQSNLINWYTLRPVGLDNRYNIPAPKTVPVIEIRLYVLSSRSTSNLNTLDAHQSIDPLILRYTGP